MEQSYKEKYEDILARLERAKNDDEVCDERFCCVIDDLIPELAESEDEKIKHEIKVVLANTDFSESALEYTFADMVAWLEKQGEQKPNGGIVREDFTQGDGWYKVNLDYLSKVQVEEIEQLVEKWNPKEVSEEEKIKKAILIYLDWLDGKKDYLPKGDYTIKDMILWLERQGEHANFLSKIQVGDKVTRNEYGVLVNLSQLNRVAKAEEKQGEQKFEMKTAEESLGIDSDTYNKIVDECIFGEQNPADSYCQENCKGFQETGKCFADGECKAKREAEQKPASEEDEPQKELAESYLAKFDEKFPILPTLKGKQLADYKNFLNKCQQIFRLKYWGIRPIQAKLFEKLSLLWAAWGAEHLQGLGQTDGDMDNEISMWSEEDEDYLFLLNSICKDAEEKYRNSPDVLVRKEIANARNWLKSLRPQSRWKPSSEQIGLLQAIINEPKNAASESCQIVLREVLEQLKKLKEE